MLRRLFIVTVLFWAMAQTAVFRDLHPGGLDASAMLAFGFIILAATTLGELAHRFHLPHITGYLLTGVACGDHFLGLLSTEVVADLKVFDILAIGLIAMDAGAALDLEGLKRRWRSVAALSGAMIAFSLLGGLLVAGLTSGIIPGIALPFLATAPLGTVFSVGLLLGVMVLATSPPVTLAVVNETKSKGDFTDTLLTTVIVNNVQVVILFAVALAVAHALAGGAAGAGGATAVLLQFGWSLILGGAIAALAALALRVIPADALLAIVGLCFVGTWVAEALDASVLLTFLVAGALLSSVAGQGPAFKRVAGTLSGPVYVLFFTLVGAGLHIDALQEMAPYALVLVVVRLVGYHASVRLTDRVLELPEMVQRYGAMGLAPQAGIALTIAIAVGAQFTGWGSSFETLGLAAVALNEMVGPILLKFSLNLSGESGAREAVAAEVETPAQAEPVTTRVDTPALETWLQESAPVVDPWADPAVTGINRLDEVVRELSVDLQVLVSDLREGPVAHRREQAHTFMQSVRREFLRVHRRLRVKAQEPDLSRADFRQYVRLQRGDLASHWKALLLDHASKATFRQEHAALEALIKRVDRLVDELPSATTGPLTAEHLAARSGDNAVLAAQKLWLRLRSRAAAILGQGELLRVVEIRSLARYHLVGFVPTYLTEVAGLLTAADRHLLERASNLFDAYERAEQALLASEQAPDATGQPVEALALEPAHVPAEVLDLRTDDTALHIARMDRVIALRTELEEEFQVITTEIDRLCDETVRVASQVLARVWRAFGEAAVRAGTPALSAQATRFSRVYRQRERSIDQLGAGLAAAQEISRGTAAAMAMDLDLVRLRSEVYELVESTARETAVDVHGRIAVQFGRVAEALGVAITALEQLLRHPPDDPVALLRGFEDITSPLTHLVDGAVSVVEQYQTGLESQNPFDVLLAGMGQSLDQLADRYTVVLGAVSARGRGLPRAPTTTTIPFRELVRGYFESQTTRDLATITETLHGQVSQAWTGIRELDRALVFTTELVRAELDVLPTGMIPPTTVELLEETLVGTLRRIAHRVDDLREAGELLSDRTERDVRIAALGHIEHLREILQAGRISEIRSRIAQVTIAQGGREFMGLAAQVANLARVARAAVGEDTVAEARRYLGLPARQRVLERGPETFRFPTERVDLPIAYRRLFSDKALEAGDLLSGREARVGRVRRVLLGEVGGARAVAVIGVGGMGKDAVVGALLRGIGDQTRFIRRTFKEPVHDVAEVADLVQEACRCADGFCQVVIVVEGFEWLFSIRPGGFEVLRAFVAGVVQTSDRVGWLVSADRPVWAYADRVVQLHDAFPERFDLGPLDIEGLRRAILSRHTMSGFRLRFRRPDDSLLWRIRERLSPAEVGQASWEQRFFAALNADSGGVLSDALRLWMASIVAIDAETEAVVIGRTPQPPVRALRELPEDELITLRQVARQGRLTPEDHAAQFRLEPEVSHAFLARLAHWGLLERDAGGRFRFRAELAGLLYRVLCERNLVG